MSMAWATLPRGVIAATAANSAGVESIFIGVSTMPGAMELKVMLSLPYFLAKALVWQIAAALEPV